MTIVTAVIPTYNRCSILLPTLEALCRQTGFQQLGRVIVVSDGSQDSTAEIAGQFSNRLPIQLIEQPKTGVAAARNRGLNEVISPVVLFLDDDVIPSPELIREHARFHEENTGPETALLGYVTWNPELPITPFMRWYGECGALFAFSRLREDREIDPRYLYSCNISFKADFLRRHGGFNEGLTVLEDNELGCRLRGVGMRLFFRRSALGFHNQTFTFKQACQRLERYSPGLPAFLLTEAGAEMRRRRRSVPFRLADACVRSIGPVLSPVQSIIDSRYRFPNGVYRLFYWYFGAHLSFWSRAAVLQQQMDLMDQSETTLKTTSKPG